MTVTITDDAGNEATVSLTFPAVSKGEQDLAGFAYTPSSLTFGDAAPSLTAPADPKGAVTYSATPPSVCTVNAGTGALTIAGAGACVVEATAAATADYEARTVSTTVTVEAAGTLALTLDAVTGDNVVNIAEQAAGFAIARPYGHRERRERDGDGGHADPERDVGGGRGLVGDGAGGGGLPHRGRRLGDGRGVEDGGSRTPRR